MFPVCAVVTTPRSHLSIDTTKTTKMLGQEVFKKTDSKHTKHINLHCDGDIQTFSHFLTRSQTMCDLQCESNGL